MVSVFWENQLGEDATQVCYPQPSRVRDLKQEIRLGFSVRVPVRGEGSLDQESGNKN